MVPSRACRQWLLKSVRKTRREALSSPGWPCRPCPGQRGSSEKRGDQRPLTRGARAPGKQAARRLAGQAAWREQSWCQQSFMGAGKQGLGSFTPSSCRPRRAATRHPTQRPPDRNHPGVGSFLETQGLLPPPWEEWQLKGPLSSERGSLWVETQAEVQPGCEGRFPNCQQQFSL